MNVKNFIDIIDRDFFIGVPDSTLKAFCNYLVKNYSQSNIIAANEGNCVGIGVGYHLATGKVPVVYLQNSGEGNIINPVTSLAKIYKVPMIFIIGWRGEPNTIDEPQHFFQGKITLNLLDTLNVNHFVIDSETADNDFAEWFNSQEQKLSEGEQIAIVVRKGALTYNDKPSYKNNYLLKREKAIEHIVNAASEDFIVSTTGKASRELFEIRERNNQPHNHDFLTVGSMGHNSSIALGIALQSPNIKVWCIDGDGALLMHMGIMANIGSLRPKNLLHIVINNGAHESVGGMPTTADNVNFSEIARACGYEYVASVDNEESLQAELNTVKNISGLSFLEIKCAIGARADLGRPTVAPLDNKCFFMESLMR